MNKTAEFPMPLPGWGLSEPIDKDVATAKKCLERCCTCLVIHPV